MTFSLLARDPESGALGGAAATGNLCVGAWVLRGKPGVGVSASQGHYPSTPWGETVLDELAKDQAPDQAVRATIAPDGGRETRQLLTLDQRGRGAGFSGTDNLPHIAEEIRPDICAGGNMLARPEVIAALVDGYTTASGSFPRRLLAGLLAGAKGGGDARGLMSAAILIVSPDHPPIDIRIDVAPDPLDALAALLSKVEGPNYAEWMRALPTTAAPYPTR